MLFNIFTQSNGLDNTDIQNYFEKLYTSMNRKILEEADVVIYLVCTLCCGHEKTGIIEGDKVGI